MLARFVIFLAMIFFPFFTYAASTSVTLEYGKTPIQNTVSFTNKWTVVGVNSDDSQKVVLLGRLTSSHTGIFDYEFIVFSLGQSSANIVDSVSFENILNQDTRLKLADGSYLTVRTQ